MFIYLTRKNIFKYVKYLNICITNFLLQSTCKNRLKSVSPIKRM